MSIEDKVINALCESLGHSKDFVRLDSKLIDDLGMDSLDGVELIMRLEDEYNISIPDEDVEAMTTVRDIVTYIEKVVGGKSE